MFVFKTGPSPIQMQNWSLILFYGVNACLSNLKKFGTGSENGFYTLELTQCAKTLEQWKIRSQLAATRPLDNDILNNTPAPFDPLQLYNVVYIVWSSYLKILFSTLFQIWYIQTRSETCKRTGCCHRLPPLLNVSPLWLA